MMDHNRQSGAKYKLNAEDIEARITKKPMKQNNEPIIVSEFDEKSTNTTKNETCISEDGIISETVLLGEVHSKKLDNSEQVSTLNDLDEETRKLRYLNLLELLNKSSKITQMFESRLEKCKEQIIKQEMKQKENTITQSVNNQSTNDSKLKDNYYLNLFQQPQLLNGQLKTHQIEGLLWIRTLYENGMNGILADDMGLGKTIQAIAFFCFLIEMGITGPFMVIAPLSTIPNWLTEFAKFAPQLHALLYHGDKKEREKIRSEFGKMHNVNDKYCYSIIITSYEVIRFDIKYLKKIEWKFIIIDEGHKLKNVDSDISRAMRQLKCTNKLILTGTPIQNNMTELWCLLNLLMPFLFNKLEDFNSWLKIDDFFCSNDEIVVLVKKDEILDTILKILKPFILRREKKDTDLKLPPKKEIIVYAPITKMQKKLYQATLNHQLEILEKKEKNIDIINGITPKRSCVQRIVKYTYNNAIRTEPIKQEVDNPNMAISLVMNTPHVQLKKIANHPYLIHMPLIPGKNEIRVNYNIVKVSGKFQVLDAMLPKLKSRGHKNPQCDLQAQDRCHRMGQEKPVVVYRLCTKNTIDERILDFGAAKRKLEKLIVGNGAFKNINNKKMTLSDADELMSLLKSSEYNKKIQSNGYIFTDKELDALLDRSDMIKSGSQKDVNQLQSADHFKVLSNS
ncbi:Hypothetical protein CINCED_3A016157 [Cinara cedri]|uniref:Helicase ATP-binding domain-containing protein n=1 Tax=Cinara cedri TaxID=506608 RepID=A0A5E4MN86_9HEMI|nr:Hypothetical protein CINCED_3A016157 [Cinara cedri]